MLGIVLFDNTVIGDRTSEGRETYKKVAKNTSLTFSKFGYCDSDILHKDTEWLRANGLCLKYFDGCFNPYLCRRKKCH